MKSISRFDDRRHGGGDVRADAVPGQQTHDGARAHDELAVLGLDEIAFGDLDVLETRHGTLRDRYGQY